ncbi:uncharacterized protein BO88DRAFT_246457 [Aspergillus vadensis CBS 113365]|uniref:Uncharacterized protein n=1 Tax=Aspergillus vadensis (strain CBS 113365 / IMI 142717 / IBT 24658) TaxID=1448311 RepID=A0A319BGF9_ASPVC|nr:hypothetical protein BO88DRAFT_246457 [Aspergillus vadensis CBS 113365]PYH71164.1 hypothetical protein BO88DRAFT_246457 [Aspergillus vadensis CBS 113365]
MRMDMGLQVNFFSVSFWVIFYFISIKKKFFSLSFSLFTSSHLSPSDFARTGFHWTR